MPQITAYTVKDFAAWLKKHHAKEKSVAVLLHKRHTGKTAPTHRELLEEALCWGWVDTTIKRVDEDIFMRRFARRSEKSKWSDNTLSYAAALVKNGRMKAQGLKFYELGKKRPTHDHGIPKNPDMPKELKTALAKNTAAKRVITAYPPSVKRMYYRWLLRAVRLETRQKRVQQMLAAAAKDTRFNIGAAAEQQG